MPIINPSSYEHPYFFKNGHWQTIYPALFRNFNGDFYQRERIDTPDDDFLDLDWSRTGSENLAIISHGLEGNSRRHYVIGMVHSLNRNGWDALAWNYRSCSGETNRQFRLYHNGAIDDLDRVIDHAIKTKKYKQIALIGYSLGGNLTLLYLGKNAKEIQPEVKKGVVFSVPCDLKGSATELTKPQNRFYMKHFLDSLHDKIKAKMELMPDKINDDNYHLIKDFKQFDDAYTAPIHGFKDAEDYWAKCSCDQYIPDIKVSTLIVNAQNDPFLSESCYPVNHASVNPYVHLEMPVSGGHVGFIQFNRDKLYWSEQRTMDFLHSHDI